MINWRNLPTGYVLFIPKMLGVLAAKLRFWTEALLSRRFPSAAEKVQLVSLINCVHDKLQFSFLTKLLFWIIVWVGVLLEWSHPGVFLKLWRFLRTSWV